MIRTLAAVVALLVSRLLVFGPLDPPGPPPDTTKEAICPECGGVGVEQMDGTFLCTVCHQAFTI